MDPSPLPSKANPAQTKAMPIDKSSLYFAALESAIDSDPLMVAPETPVAEVLALMTQLRSSCPISDRLPTSEAEAPPKIRSSCVLIVEGWPPGATSKDTSSAPSQRPIGIFTERDIVRLTAAGQNLKNITVGEVMTREAITITKTHNQDIFTALSLFRHHKIRHLPVLGERGEILGVITPTSIRRALQPANLISQLRYVKDVMSTQVIHTPTTTSVLDLARLMAEHRVSCVVICESADHQGKTLTKPVGIVTERDIVQFQALDLDLQKMHAEQVMSAPLFCLNPNDFLWLAHQEMQRRRVRRLVVAGNRGELLGIVSQTSLLQALEPTEMYGMIEALQRAVEDGTKELQESNTRLSLEIVERRKAEVALKTAHDDLQKKVEERTEELQKANALLQEDIKRREQVEAALRRSEAHLRKQTEQLEKALQSLKQTQSQLIQSEKMSSLGSLVAGIAHEINNPVNFIYGNISHASQYIRDILKLVKLYKKYYPEPVDIIAEQIDDMDLDFMISDLPKLLESMQFDSERIRQIVLSLRNFSRLDEAEMKWVDVHEGLESTLFILQHRLQVETDGWPITVVKEYGSLPPVECYPGALNQVFMNILTNAIEALERQGTLRENSPSNAPRCITITTQLVPDGSEPEKQWVEISIADNGPGMTKTVRRKIFEPFFTTKPVGKGTGLGLSICHQIIAEKHGGQLECVSQPNQGCEFIIRIPVRQVKGTG
ncbi:MAG: ATP-binding protein [Oscillatoriaceae cyanobacterium]